MRRVAVAVIVACTTLGASQAGADDPHSGPPATPAVEHGAAPGAEQLQFAAHEHDLGYRAYVGKQFDEAATHFENAFFAAPNPVELRNAIRARRDARQLARAATLAAIGQRKFASDPATSKLADDTIAEARPAVFEVQIESAEPFGVAIDEKIVVVERSRSVRVFTAPGQHDLLVSWADDRSKRTVIDAKAGLTQSLLFEAPAVAVPAPPPPAPTVTPPPAPPPAPSVVPPPAAPPPAPEERASKPFSPPVFIAVAGLTAVAAGLTTWSGLDAQSNPGPDAVRNDCVGLGESCATYQKGLSAQLRTNVLIGVTCGLGLSAAAIGVFFTDWSGGAKADLGPGAASGPRSAGGPHAPHAPGLGRPHVEPFVGPASAGLVGTF